MDLSDDIEDYNQFKANDPIALQLFSFKFWCCNLI